jgi:hypothetical protein
MHSLEVRNRPAVYILEVEEEEEESLERNAYFLQYTNGIPYMAPFLYYLIFVFFTTKRKINECQ